MRKAKPLNADDGMDRLCTWLKGGPRTSQLRHLLVLSEQPRGRRSSRFKRNKAFPTKEQRLPERDENYDETTLNPLHHDDSSGYRRG